MAIWWQLGPRPTELNLSLNAVFKLGAGTKMPFKQSAMTPRSGFDSAHPAGCGTLEHA
eukprot:COSAG06_NODE_63390_length_262_cov_0.926380_1_plen_57_part_10